MNNTATVFCGKRKKINKSQKAKGLTVSLKSIYNGANHIAQAARGMLGDVKDKLVAVVEEVDPDLTTKYYFDSRTISTTELNFYNERETTECVLKICAEQQYAKSEPWCLLPLSFSANKDKMRANQEEAERNKI
jgi:hypothetical protein